MKQGVGEKKEIETRKALKQKLICPRESVDKRKRKEKGFEMSRHSRQGVGERKRKEKEKREERN